MELVLAGAILHGQVRLPNSIGPDQRGGFQGSVRLLRDPAPSFQTSDDRRAWRNSAEGREWQRGHREYLLKFDGERFTSDPVSQGRYSVYIWNGFTHVSGSREIVVSDDAPIDLGEIQLKEGLR